MLRLNLTVSAVRACLDGKHGRVFASLSEEEERRFCNCLFDGADLEPLSYSGYPLKPYVRLIAHRLYEWSSRCVYDDTPPSPPPPITGLLEVPEFHSSLALVWSSLCIFASRWNDFVPEQSMLNLLRSIGPRGVLTILGLRQTKGSTCTLPPARELLIQSFNLPSGPKEPLTVGARAWTKHYHRSSDGWWGKPKGNDVAKNIQATEVLNRILHDAVWVNLHLLPGELEMVEVRTVEGYGARWTADGLQFRGFLEPTTTDGHEKGWRH
mmetsp:Transcript_38115/g.61719  ORF Transcript_38115/g.61719 Transcript_38115/m.61719 type:complete len:267 (-) Transcript_38115:625-1425(-)|eukprot:CAMPEP_0184672326 /NCGR_PEP_ID=MMETSP0308-20130426/86039_1 /TAXON_ID=38269 /ORGANISM="Gloeochaete witrockiana, Strain SAG 46.84" /LENGTH=266 /DNA_ID=CAMNT_0027119641 /DNA_START=54 /DNA_END=854 /DNA_ORIENTATION=-